MKRSIKQHKKCEWFHTRAKAGKNHKKATRITSSGKMVIFG